MNDNSRELLRQADMLQLAMKKWDWVFILVMLMIFVIPILGCFIALIGFEWLGYRVAKLIGDYMIMTFPFGLGLGFIWEISMPPLSKKVDKLKSQAYKQWGDDEEEY